MGVVLLAESPSPNACLASSSTPCNSLLIFHFLHFHFHSNVFTIQSIFPPLADLFRCHSIHSRFTKIHSKSFDKLWNHSHPVCHRSVLCQGLKTQITLTLIACAGEVYHCPVGWPRAWRMHWQCRLHMYVSFNNLQYIHTFFAYKEIMFCS